MVEPIKLDRLTREDWIPGEPEAMFVRRMAIWQSNCEQIEEAVNSVIDAINAAAAADAAAAVALAAADAADAAAVAVTSEQELVNSYVGGVSITATDAGSDATISITAHTRYYGDGTSVSVNSGSITGRAYSTLYYIYYDQPSRAGGAVTYLSTTDDTVAVQSGDRHVVGSVTTPAALAADSTGGYVRPPGVGGIREP